MGSLYATCLMIGQTHGYSLQDSTNQSNLVEWILDHWIDGLIKAKDISVPQDLDAIWQPFIGRVFT